MNTAFTSYVCIYEWKYESTSNDARFKYQNKYSPKSNRKLDYDYFFKHRWIKKKFLLDLPV